MRNNQRGHARQTRNSISSSSSSLSTASSHTLYDQNFSILCIRAKRNRRRHLQDGTEEIVAEYLVHWLNFPDPQFDTWEPEENLREDCPEMLAEFNRHI